MAKSKVTTYKGFKIEQVGENDYNIYTADEWAYGKGYRSVEHEVGSIQEAKDFINSY